ncbi:MAG: hypothetical protein HDR41_00190 [Lactobacillus sp.]|nr:hypothetical protein [Lactobacillus sp.]
MVEETNTTETIPEWKKKADELSKQVGNGIWVQLAYLSDSKHDCQPILLSEKQTETTYPIVVEAPVGMNAPKFAWNENAWVDTSVEGQSMSISKLQDQVKSLTDDNEEMQQQLTAKNKEIDSLQSTLATANLNMAKLGSQFNTFGIQVMGTLKGINDKLDGKTTTTDGGAQ